MYAGDFEAAIGEQQAVLEINPRFPSAYAGLALAQLASGQVAASRATWQKLLELGPAGASLAAVGLTDLALFEGKAVEARTRLEEAIEADLKANDPDSAAYKMTLLAEAHQVEGRRDRAVATALRARQTSRAEAVSYCAGRVLVEGGDSRSAAAIAEELERSLETEPRMYGLLLRGELELRRGAHREALERFKQAQALSDSWLSRYGQGRAYLAAGAFTEAHGQLEACLRRRGEATDLFLNIWPSYRFLPPVYYELGRTEEGLKAPRRSGLSSPSSRSRRTASTLGWKTPASGSAPARGPSRRALLQLDRRDPGRAAVVELEDQPVAAGGGRCRCALRSVPVELVGIGARVVLEGAAPRCARGR